MEDYLTMIKIVYGPKGFGKTKIMIDDVNQAAEVAKGNVVFVTDKRINSVSINLNVRCVYTSEHGIDNYQAFVGFINGLLAGNSDIEYIYIDGFRRIIGEKLRGGQKVFKAIKALQKEYPELKFVVSISATKEELPSYLKRYAK